MPQHLFVRFASQTRPHTDELQQVEQGLTFHRAVYHATTQGHLCAMWPQAASGSTVLVHCGQGCSEWCHQRPLLACRSDQSCQPRPGGRPPFASPRRRDEVVRTASEGGSKPRTWSSAPSARWSWFTHTFSGKSRERGRWRQGWRKRFGGWGDCYVAVSAADARWCILISECWGKQGCLSATSYQLPLHVGTRPRDSN